MRKFLVSLPFMVLGAIAIEGQGLPRWFILLFMFTYGLALRDLFDSIYDKKGDK